MHRRLSIITVALVLALAAATACGPELSPEEEIADNRSHYSAEINGIAVQSTPMEPAVGETGEGEQAEGAGEAAPAEEAEGETAGAEASDPMEGEQAASPEVRQDVILDILVSKEGRGESLDHLTVDIEQVDENKNVKETWRAYLDVSDVHRGPGTQITHRLEDVDYEEGDGFFAEVRHPVPPEERTEYRELQEHGSDG